METSNYDSYCKAFAEVCKKHELKKDSGTEQLFACYTDILYHMKKGQYEQTDKGLLELAKLIMLLETGTGIKVSRFEGGEVDIQNPFVLANMLMHLHTDLNTQSGGFYSIQGMAKEKGRIKEGFTYKGVSFEDTGNFTEPYTNDELQTIIDFEDSHEAWRRGLKGRNRNGGNNPMLGSFVVQFLACCPSLFGNFYCYTGPNGEPLLANFPPTKQYNIIGDLLAALGVLEQFKGKGWVETRWNYMNASERKKEVEGWQKSYEKAENNSPLQKAGWSISPDSNLYKNYKTMPALNDELLFHLDLNKEFAALDW